MAIALAVTLLTLYAAALRADALVTTLGPIGEGGVVDKSRASRVRIECS